MLHLQGATDWERKWAAYDQSTYDLVLERLQAADVVLDIGAGDLRLTRQIAARVRRVYAIEIDPGLLAGARGALPANLALIEGDALVEAYPPGLTCGVLLMRHSTHYAAFASRLREAGAARLITNARWRMSVEVVDLLDEGSPYDLLPFGWYACRCGATGFKPGPAEALTPENVKPIHEVRLCPACTPQEGSRPQDDLSGIS